MTPTTARVRRELFLQKREKSNWISARKFGENKQRRRSRIYQFLPEEKETAQVFVSSQWTGH